MKFFLGSWIHYERGSFWLWVCIFVPRWGRTTHSYVSSSKVTAHWWWHAGTQTESKASDEIKWLQGEWTGSSADSRKQVMREACLLGSDLLSTTLSFTPLERMGVLCHFEKSYWVSFQPVMRWQWTHYKQRLKFKLHMQETAKKTCVLTNDCFKKKKP